MEAAIQREPGDVPVLEQIVRSLPRVLAVAAVLVALALWDYPYFHGVVEIFSIVVAVSLLIVVWNGRKMLDTDYLLLIGFAYLFFAILDVPHLLAAPELRLFPGYPPDLPGQLYLVQRFITAAAFLAAPFFLRRRLPVRATVATLIVVSVVLTWTILIARVFPTVLVPGDGHTTFMLVAEAVIALMFLGSSALVYVNRRDFAWDVMWMLVSVTLAFVFSEVFFSMSVQRRGVFDILGSLAQALAFYLTYRAVVVTAYTRPQMLLFRQLAEREKGLSEAREQVEQELATTRLLLDAAQALSGWTDLDAILTNLGHVVLRATGRRRIQIILEQEGTTDLLVSCSVGEQAIRAGTVIPYDRTSAGLREVIASERTAVADYDAMPEGERGPADEFHMRVVLLVPMCYQGRLAGIIGVDDPGRSHEFSRREIEIVEAIAAEAAVAVESARLFEHHRQTEIRLRATFDSAAAGIVVGSLKGTILETNPAFDAMLGYSSEETCGARISDFSLPEDHVKDEELLRELLAGRRDTYRLEKRYVRKDGSTVWASLSASLVRDEDGEPLFVMNVIEDISERKRAEEGLREKDRAIRQAYTDVIDAVTGGKLIIMTPQEITAALGDVVLAPRRISQESALAGARREVREAIDSIEPPPRVVDEFVLAASEAMTNAVKYGGGGEVGVRRTHDCVQVVVTDFGPGIEFGTLPRATLVPGFSTQTSLGMGFTIMLEVADRVLLATEPTLTIVVLEVALEREPLPATV